MQRAKVRNFLVQGLVATAIGAAIGTAVLLVWWDIYAAFFDNARWPGRALGLLAMLPLALPFAMALATPVAILPAYFLGASLNYVLGRLRVTRPAVRVAIGSLTGGWVGALLLWPMERGPEVGLIFGAAVGGAWFAVERAIPQALRKPGPWD